ncbi:uncharacterized protein [Macrobrachium rosenbergii]|uniref:uncharacterized protein n=1 Tax=Macrobrachium rosenbergii TaxID=79674 RepID=UPI0034D3E6BB
MLAMAVVNHKGGGGGLGSKRVEEEDDILTTLRRLRQTLQECHGRVGLMDQRVNALQPHYKKEGGENNMNFRWSNFHAHSLENYVKEDQCHTQISEIPLNHMVTGMTDRSYNDIEALEPTSLEELHNYPEITNKTNLYMNGLVQPLPQKYPCALELDLVSLAEKHAKELCDMYHSKSNAMNGRNCEKSEQRTVMVDVKSERNNDSEISRDNGENKSDMHLKGVCFQILESNGDPLSRINGVKLPEEKKVRKFSKCKEWWAERLSSTKTHAKDLYENGIEEVSEKEENSHLQSLEEMTHLTVNEDFYKQESLESYTVSKRETPRVSRRKERVLIRKRNIDLEDLPEECEYTDFLLTENTESRTKECHEDSPPVVHEMGEESSTDNEAKLLVEARISAEIDAEGETRGTEDSKETKGTASVDVPVYKIQSSLDVVEKSLDDFRKSISELSDNLKHMNSSQELNLNSFTVTSLTDANEDSESISDQRVNRFKSSDVPWSIHNSKICLMNRKWNYSNKAKEHNCSSMLNMHGVSEDSRRSHKIRKRNNFAVKLIKCRGSGTMLFSTDKEKLINHRQYKDKQSWLHKFLIFLVFMMLSFFVFYIVITVPIITLSVKHNGRPVAF